MIKNLRKRCKNKKGFTMVELIVVIVIILVLTALLVPTILKYVDRAAQANTKADAATALMQIQADVADSYATSNADLANVTVGGITMNKGTLASGKVTGNPVGIYTTDGKGAVTGFSYQDKKHWIKWTSTNGWSDMDPS